MIQNKVWPDPKNQIYAANFCLLRQSENQEDDSQESASEPRSTRRRRSHRKRARAPSQSTDVPRKRRR